MGFYRFQNGQYCTAPMLVDKTNFSLVLYNHANFYQFEDTSDYWSVKRIFVFLCFSLVNQRHTPSITVYNRTVTNIENIVRDVHSCNSWFQEENALLACTSSMTLRLRAKVLLHVWSYDFYDKTTATSYDKVIH